MKNLTNEDAKAFSEKLQKIADAVDASRESVSYLANSVDPGADVKTLRIDIHSQINDLRQHISRLDMLDFQLQQIASKEEAAQS